VTIWSTFHLLHEVIKLNYKVSKRPKSQTSDAELVSGCQWSCHRYCGVKLKHFRNLEHAEQPITSPHAAVQDRHHLQGLYHGKRPQV